jgi:hypothetical protein
MKAVTQHGQRRVRGVEGQNRSDVRRNGALTEQRKEGVSEDAVGGVTGPGGKKESIVGLEKE